MAGAAEPAAAVKVLGERNSGTNLVERLLAANTSTPVIDNNISPRAKRFFAALKQRTSRTTYHRLSEPMKDVLFLRLLRDQHGWKHAAVTERYLDRLPAELAVVAVTKDPYAWLLSLYRHPYHRRPVPDRATETLGDFLRRPWPTVRRERVDREYPTPVDLWNAKTRSYRLLDDHPRGIAVRYESLTADIPGTLAAIAGACGLDLAEEIQVPERSVKRSGQRATEDIIEHYATRAFLDEYEAADIAFVNERLDPEVMAAFAYEYVEDAADP